ncbi:TonB-dependent siderophore receptor [Geothrix sp. PMB-07]|uniref:TonB-dependent receptor plug domain-containing protein n=1 Tax=Geothrix sp. PMB-07 TaxID=3068640 RepID=UPI0027427F4C|nr:TonB-dependent receptor [Geothrix sp. PMB-07]WLT31392.1 TonB-dependent receptor [Geothrix sp. PMB-07]
MKIFAALPIAFGLVCSQQPVWAQEKPLDLEAELTALLNTKVEVASKSAEKLSDAPGVISVISKDELQRFGGNSLADVLSRVPGMVHIASYFSDRSMMAAPGDNLRGLKSSVHVLVLFDGRPVREVQEGGIKDDIYETFPVAAIDHIEVIKGPGSVLYGSEAFAAVINIVTDKPKETGGALAGSFASNGGYKHWGKVDVASGDLTLSATIQAIKPSEWDTKYGFGTTPNGPTTVITPANLDPKGESAFLHSTYKGFSLTGGFFKWDTPFMIADYMGDVSGKRSTKNYLDLGYNFEINDRWNITANGTYNKATLKVNDGGAPGIERDSDEWLLELTSFYSLNTKGKFIVGALYSKATGTEKTLGSPSTTTSTGSRASQALYSQLDYLVAPEVKTIVGFQALKVGEADSTLVPRLGVIWNPTQQINAKLLYGEAFRAPYINENFIDFLGFLKGDKALKPEKVKSTQASLSYSGTSGQVTVSAFQNKQSDLVVFTSSPTLPAGFLQYQNLAKAKIEGFEVEGKYYASKSLMLVGSVLSQRPGDGELTGISNFGAKAGISYSGEYGVVSLFDVHQGSIDQSLYNTASSNPKPGSYDLVSLHAKLNLNEVFGFKSKAKFEAFLQGDNILDKEVWIVATGDSEFPSSIPFNKGRTVYLGAKVSF